MITYYQQQKGLFTFYKQQQEFLKKQKAKQLQKVTIKKSNRKSKSKNNISLSNNADQSNSKIIKKSKNKIHYPNPTVITEESLQLNSPQVTQINKTDQFLKQIIYDKKRSNNYNYFNSINSNSKFPKSHHLINVQSSQNISSLKKKQSIFNSQNQEEKQLSNSQFNLKQQKYSQKEDQSQKQEQLLKYKNQKNIQSQLINLQELKQKIIPLKKLKLNKKQEKFHNKTQGAQKTLEKVCINSNIFDNQMLHKFQKSIEKSNSCSQHHHKSNLPSILAKNLYKNSQRKKRAISNSDKDLKLGQKKKQSPKISNYISKDISHSYQYPQSIYENKFLTLLKKIQELPLSPPTQDLNLPNVNNKKEKAFFYPIHKIQTIDAHKIKSILLTSKQKLKQEIFKHSQSVKQLSKRSKSKKIPFRHQSFKKIITNPLQNDLINKNKGNSLQTKNILIKNVQIKSNTDKSNAKLKNQQKKKKVQSIKLNNINYLESSSPRLHQKNNSNYLNNNNNNNSLVSFVELGVEGQRGQNLDWVQRKKFFLKKLGINKIGS